MKKFLFSYRYHFLYWISFGLYEILSVAVVTGSFAKLLNYVFHYLLNIVLFYVHAGLILPVLQWKGRNKHIILALLIGIQTFSYLLLSWLLNGILSTKGLASLNVNTLSWSFTLSSIWRAIYFMGFATTYYFFLQYRSEQQRNLKLERAAKEKVLADKKLELELAQARHDYLHAQVNPHFLMNTLTFIYNKTHKSEPFASKAVFYLSKLLRYNLQTERGGEMRKLGPEIEQVENLLHLCRIKDNELYLDFHYSPELEEIKVIPMVLLSLAENMIKHGNLSEQERPGKISIIKKGNNIEIETVNLINTGINDTGTHSGIKNLRQRLAFAYQHKANIHMGPDEDGYFIVRLILPAF